MRQYIDFEDRAQRIAAQRVLSDALFDAMNTAVRVGIGPVIAHHNLLLTMMAFDQVLLKAREAAGISEPWEQS